VTTNADTCQPARLSGVVGDEPVTVAAAGINIAVPLQSGHAWSRYELLAATDHGTPVDELAGCGSASEHLELQKIGSTADGLEVSAIQDWTVSSPCATDGVPAASCHADQMLAYSLRMTCKLPLVITVALDGTTSCAQ
jgi:hypothetical protein